jgi:hypothetical protein
MMRTCTRCRERFEAKGNWQKLCWPCWREERDGEERDGEERDKIFAVGFADGYVTGLLDGRRGGLDESTLRAAIVLCHPDRHPPERAAEANRITAALLELREEATRG